MVHLTRDSAFAGLQFDLRDLRERDQRTAACRHYELADGFGTVARVRGKSHGSIVAAFANEQLAHCPTANSDLDEVSDLGNVDAIARRRGAIDLDNDLWKRGLLLDCNVARARDCLQHLYNFPAEAPQLVEVVAKNL